MAERTTGFIAKTMEVDEGTRDYVLYVPDNYDPGREWPLIVFLHGRGERGDDGIVQSEVGIGPAIQANPDRFPCLVLMPQCPDTGYWNQARPHITKSMEDTLRDYAIDEDRIYLTGLSMGGYGTWTYGAAEPHRFAALMPICGGGRVRDADILSSIPVWAFHGDADPVVDIKETQKMIDALKAAGGSPKFTIYLGVGHNSWDDAYGDPEAIAWLLSHRRKK